MRDKLIMLLKRFPLLHRFFQNFYWKILETRAKILGTKIEEKKWRSRTINEVKKDFNNLNHPHRGFLIKEISKLYPFSKVLEVGCGYGPNLYLLAECFSKVEFTGIDINPLSIKEGIKWLNDKKNLNVKLLVGGADDLFKFPDKNFDIVFTDAVLMYIGPDKIKKTIKEMMRVARRALVFLEWHCQDDNSEGAGIYHFGHWKRNHLNLLKQFVRKEQISFAKLPKKNWRVKDWQEFGYLIKVIL